MKKLLISLVAIGTLTLPVLANEEVPSLTEEQKAILKTEIQEATFDQDKIVNYKTFKISAVDNDKIKNNNKLIMYTSLCGKTTKTDSKKTFVI